MNNAATPERIDGLLAPPVVGRRYLVPMVHGLWHGRPGWWPVMGELHDDTRFFRFRAVHYHIDRRFLANRRDVKRAVASPLHGRPELGYELSEPVWKPRTCKRSAMSFPTHPEPVREMQRALAGAACAKGGGGWICPHRGFALGSIAPDANGVLTCPLHGLRIDATSGKVSTAE